MEESDRDAARTAQGVWALLQPWEHLGDKDVGTRLISLAAPCPEATSCPQGHRTARISEPRQERIPRASAASRPTQPRSRAPTGEGTCPEGRGGISWKWEGMNSQLAEPKQPLGSQRRLIAIPRPCRPAEPQFFSSRRDHSLLEEQKKRAREAAPGARSCGSAFPACRGWLTPRASQLLHGSGFVPRICCLAAAAVSSAAIDLRIHPSHLPCTEVCLSKIAE